MRVSIATFHQGLCRLGIPFSSGCSASRLVRPHTAEAKSVADDPIINARRPSYNRNRKGCPTPEPAPSVVWQDKGKNKSETEKVNKGHDLNASYFGKRVSVGSKNKTLKSRLIAVSVVVFALPASHPMLAG